MQPFQTPWGTSPPLYIDLDEPPPAPHSLGVCLYQTYSHCLNEFSPDTQPCTSPIGGEVLVLPVPATWTGLSTTPLQLKYPFLSQCVLRP